MRSSNSVGLLETFGRCRVRCVEEYPLGVVAAEDDPSAVKTDRRDCCCLGSVWIRMLAIDARKQSKGG